MSKRIPRKPKDRGGGRRGVERIDPHTRPNRRRRGENAQRAGKLLDAKQRSVEELRERILEKGGRRGGGRADVSKLGAIRLLDDGRYASDCRRRASAEAVGRQSLARDLQMKKFEETDARRSTCLRGEEDKEERLTAR